MPFNPKKCCGKKVMFTPINIIVKWIFKSLGFRDVPVNKENQWVIPPKIPNTAPIEST